MRVKVSWKVWVDGFEEPFIVDNDKLGNPEFGDDGSIVFKWNNQSDGPIRWKFANYRVIEEVFEHLDHIR